MPGKKRKYLPKGLTKKEKKSKILKKKLASCIKKVEKRACPKSAKGKGGKYDYRKCMVNPVAVCRASIEKPKKKKKKKKRKTNPSCGCPL